MLAPRNRKLLESTPMRWSWWNNWESFHFSTHAPIFSPHPLHLPVFSNLLFSCFLLSYFLSLFLPPPKQALTYGCEPRCAYFHRIIHPMLGCCPLPLPRGACVKGASDFEMPSKLNWSSHRLRDPWTQPQASPASIFSAQGYYIHCPHAYIKQNS